MGNLCNQPLDPVNQEQQLDPSQKTLNPKKTIRVATLNYCGIMNSPFQFYCADYYKELDLISDIFVTLIPKYFPDFNPANFSWKMGKIDVKLRTGRYSPMFSPTVGIINDQFITRQNFQKQWQRIFKIQVLKIPDLKYTQQQKKTTLLYDLLMYHTLLKFVFKIEEIEEAKHLNTNHYLKIIKPFFELSFLNEKRKLDKLKDSFAKIDADVFFFEEYSKYFYEYLQQQKIYHLNFDPSNDTLIIAKKQVFPKQKLFKDNESHIQQILKKLNLPGTIAVMIVDRYIILGVHLSSKTDKNKEQVEALRKGLIDLKKLLQQNNLDFEIILGGDLNSYFPHFSNKYNIFPEEGGQLTTVKKRTMTQGQFHKGRKLVEQSKDKIISTLPIIRGSIKYITDQQAQKTSLVPNDKHPFDHFVVVTQLRTI